MKSSSERNTGTEFRTSTGPPPSAATTLPQAGCRIKRAAICVPTGASAWSLAASEPAAWMTAPPGGMGSPPFAPTAVTTAERSTFGAVAGKDCSTISAEPWMAGAFGPNAGVSRTTCPWAATWLRPLSGRRCPVPCQVPKNLTRSTCSPPAESTPIEEREPNGGWASTPPDMNDPCRVPVARAEEIAVDPGDRGLAGDVLLDLGDPLAAAEDRPAGEHGRQLVETALVAGPRRREHVHDHRTVRGELDGPVVGDPGKERRALGMRRCRTGRREHEQGRETAQHP